MKDIPGKVLVIVTAETQHFYSWSRRLLLAFRHRPNVFKTTKGFDAAQPTAVFLKLPCLKLFDHDKIMLLYSHGRFLP